MEEPASMILAPLALGAFYGSKTTTSAERHPYRSFRELGVPYFGVLTIRILLFRVP